MPPAKKPVDIDSYIEAAPEYARARLQKVRETVAKAAPKAVETLSYGMPAFRQGVNLVYFAAWKNHIGFYPTAGPIAAFREELADYEGARGSVQFPFDRPLPVKLITRMVQFRLMEVEARAGRKGRSAGVK